MGVRGGGRTAGMALLGLVLLVGSVPVGEAEAARGRKESMPGPRGPKVPRKLPASSLAPAESVRLPVRTEAGRYASSLDALSPAAARHERDPASSYSYCLRTVTTYEHVYYGPSGALRRGYSRAVQHGTGFAYRVKDGQFFVATNHHVASLPEVTSSSTPVDGVPNGARKVRESVYIVSSEADDRTAGGIELTPVLADPLTDLAILKTSQPLQVMPFCFGRSAELAVGNVVFARGYPLGVMPAFNVGRVTNAAHRDTDSGWDHLDFITDAALNNGNSGSPVFAISRQTGEPELVGIFHAHYRSATGMGVVVAIDEVREMLETLRPRRPETADRDDRAETRGLLAAHGKAVYFPFAGLTARAVMLETGTRFEVYDEFPTSETVKVCLVSRESGPQLVHPSLQRSASERELLREPVDQLERGLWSSLATALRLRREVAAGDGSPEARKRIAQLRKRLSAGADAQKELLSVIDFESQARGPRPTRVAPAEGG
ncbi:MAG: trypsin-like peptidase domain-containing protein [Myxococcales bacterium]|jgi:S1-C subfamily serine protease